MDPLARAHERRIKILERRIGGSSGSSVPNSRQIVSGAGLTGGGDLSADRTFDIGAGTGITVNANDVAASANLRTLAIKAGLFLVNDVAVVYVPYACTITAWRITGHGLDGANASGSAVVDVWNDSDTNYPLTVADSIAGAEKPTLSSDNHASDTSLNGGAGWALAADSWLGFMYESGDLDYVQVHLTGIKTS